MDEINSPFKPSIKLLPLIKINKQNAVNNKLKLELSKRLSKNISLEEDISNLRMYMLKIIIIPLLLKIS